MLPYFVFLFQQWIFTRYFKHGAGKICWLRSTKVETTKNSSKGATFPKSFRCEIYYNFSAWHQKNTGPFFFDFWRSKKLPTSFGGGHTSPPPPHTIFSFIFYHSIIHQNNTINSRGSPYTKLHGAPKEVPNKKSLIQHMHQGSTPCLKNQQLLPYNKSKATVWTACMFWCFAWLNQHL